jgi:tetratricopeptide (TPR) repeat protein
VAGAFYLQGARYESALSCRTAALSLRPDDLQARVNLGEAQYSLGHLSAALATLRDCVGREPSHQAANYQLGLVQLMLGDFSGALASFSRSPGIAADPHMRCDLQAARYYNGLSTRDEVERQIASVTVANDLASYLLALVDHPDPARRDPELVLRTLEEWRPVFGDWPWHAVVEGLARVRLEDWSGAYALLGTRFQRPNLMVLSPMAYDFVRALIASHLGRADEARACYQRAMVEWAAETADDPAAWESSDALRWRREAEAVLPD